MGGEGGAVGAGADREGAEGVLAGWGPLGGGEGAVSWWSWRIRRRMRSVEGRTILTDPSHELDAKVSFVVWFQKTENVSLLCSW